jgi:hypothetical protein
MAFLTLWRASGGQQARIAPASITGRHRAGNKPAIGRCLAGLSPASGHAIRDLVIDGACSFTNIDLLKLSRFDGLEKDWREKRGWMPIA